MEKKRAPRNQTLTLTDAEKSLYISRCITPKRKTSIEKIENKTLFGDSIKILPHLPQKFVDLLIVDPPYNLRKNFGSESFCHMSEERYENYTRDWISALLHTLKDDASIYVCCDWRSSIAIGKVMSEFFIIQNRITWQREKGRGSMCNWKNSMEDIWFATKSKDYHFHPENVKMRRKVLAPYREDGMPRGWVSEGNEKLRDTYPSNFWDDITVPFWSMCENTDHPTQKPEKLLAKLILASSSEGDFVLDPFLGSGTTSVVAKKLHRCYAGIEQNMDYCALAEARLTAAQSNHSIQGYEDGVFWERNSLALRKYLDK